MSFEKQVLEVVTKVLKTNNTASFCFGSLFVVCTSREAAKVETALYNVLPNGGIIVSAQGPTQPGQAGEFSFDFIA